MLELRPTTERELAEALAAAAQSDSIIALGGASSKRRMSAIPFDPGVSISTACLRRVLQYEPRDLTISVEAGLPFAELTGLLAEHRQMIPLDPPYLDRATVGGVVAANTAGPRRRLYGTVRDSVIGMSFAMLDGKVAKSGGMVVKNVAGYDLAKLMIGSFGTLAAISVVNFKVSPAPVETRTFVEEYASAGECGAARDTVLRGVMQPAALDALNSAASRRVGLEGYALLMQAGGSPAMLARYEQELPQARVIEGDAERELWRDIREFTPKFVAGHPAPHVARVSVRLSQIEEALRWTSSPAVVRAASGVCYLHFDSAEASREWTERNETHQLRYVFEYGVPASNRVFESDFDMMKAMKDLFDPAGLLNPGRLYGRI